MEAILQLKFFQKHFYGNGINEIVNAIKIKPENFWEADKKYNEYQQGFSYSKRFEDISHIDEGEIEKFLDGEEFSQENLDSISKMMGYELEFSITIYSNGQPNPGIHLGSLIFKLFQNKFGFLPEIDIDIYCIGDDDE